MLANLKVSDVRAQVTLMTFDELVELTEAVRTLRMESAR